MKYIVLVILMCLFASCTNSYKFKVYQSIKVIDGFYQGCIGKVGHETSRLHGYRSYLVKLCCPNARLAHICTPDDWMATRAIVKENQLEAQNGN